MPQARQISPERMDDPKISQEELSKSLGFLRRFNRRHGGVRPVLRRLQKWSAGWPSEVLEGVRPVSVLDIGTGGADVPVAMARWGRARGLDLRVTAIDVNPVTVDLARRHVADAGLESSIGVERLDALALGEKYGLTGKAPRRRFDYVHTSLFLHHLENDKVVRVLRTMDGLAERGVFWNDLLRSGLARAGVRVLTASAPKIVKHDARVSVDAGFTRDEVRGLITEAGYTYGVYREMLASQRFLFAGERPGAWPS